MKWVTREKAHVDRIACPWLITRFVDPEAEFLFVGWEEVLQVAKREGAIPFDVQGAELSHYTEEDEERVSFDAVVRRYGIQDAALLDMAEIVRTADAKEVSRPRPEGNGLRAAAEGFRAIAKDDHDNIRLQFPLYDALYAYCQQRVAERDNADAAE